MKTMSISCDKCGADITLEPSQSIYLGKSKSYDLCLKCYDSIAEKLADVEKEIFEEGKNEQPRKVEEMKAKNELAKLLDDTQKDILNSDMGESYLRIDGKEYYTDMGYALEGIEIFIEILKERIENEQKQNN